MHRRPPEKKVEYYVWGRVKKKNLRVIGSMYYIGPRHYKGSRHYKGPRYYIDPRYVGIDQSGRGRAEESCREGWTCIFSYLWVPSSEVNVKLSS